MPSVRTKRSAFTSAPAPQDDYKLEPEVDGVEPKQPEPQEPEQPATQEQPSMQVNDRNESRSYSLPRSVHDYLTTEAIKQSAATGKRVSASKLLLELIQKGMK